MSEESGLLCLHTPPFDKKYFLEGPAGTGKTTLGVERLLALLQSGIDSETILLLVPQRTLAQPYVKALANTKQIHGAMLFPLTLGGIARRAVDLFWPLIAKDAGFEDPAETPIFLTIETAQYFLAHLLEPLWSKGLFQTLTIDRNRMYSQILDNLNKAALVGFPHDTIAERLISAWVGKPEQKNIYKDAQYCATLFRRYCLQHSLLDFSLQVELFRDFIWPSSFCRKVLFSSYRHLIYDNLEEDAPLAHDMVVELLPELDSALLIYDWDAGYRRFLAADPISGYRLKEVCEVHLEVHHSYVTPLHVQTMASRLVHEISPKSAPKEFKINTRPESSAVSLSSSAPEEAIVFASRPFFPSMLDWVADEVEHLVKKEAIPPKEIVVLSPYMPDVLSFSLIQRLKARGIPWRTHRPSHAWIEEPAVRCLLTLSCLAFPQWGLVPSRQDFAHALTRSIEGMDLIRAYLFSEIVYRVRRDGFELSSFERIQPAMQERLTFTLGEKFEVLRKWLQEEHDEQEPYDYFLNRMFGEVLSQPGFGFHRDFDGIRIAYNMVESVQKFRWAVGPVLEKEGIPVGREFVHMVQSGVISAQYLRSWQVDEADAVLIAPAFTFLMRNQAVEVQFWVDISSRGWAERLYQPLTHPYVLSRAWTMGRKWTDEDEFEMSRFVLSQLVLGLLRRCRKRVYLGISKLSAGGYEYKGPLLQAFQRVMRHRITGA